MAANVTLTRTGGTVPVVMTDLKGSILYRLTPAVATPPYGVLAAGSPRWTFRSSSTRLAATRTPWVR